MKYLVPYDFSTIGQNALKQAIKLLRVTGGDLFLLHIVANKEDFKQKERQLKDYVVSLPESKEISISSHVVVGDVFTDIGKIAEYHGADLVVMGTHGVDAWQRIFGSHSVKIISHSIVPFVVVQEQAEINQIKKIVMPMSFASESTQVLRFAVEISKVYDAEIHLIVSKQKDEWIKHKVQSNLIFAERFMEKSGVKHSFEIAEVRKSDFLNYIFEYSAKNEVDLMAVTYYSDSILPMFEKFVQQMITNPTHIPVLCVNAQSLKKAGSQFSFITT